MPNEDLVPTREMLAELIAHEASPCLSLYMSTSRRFPESKQDITRFRNLLKQAREKLKSANLPGDGEELLAPLEAIAADEMRWNHSLDGIAVFSSPATSKIVALPHTVNDLVMVSEHFYTKPIRKFLQSTFRYQILCLSLDEMQIFEGSRNTLEPAVTGTEVPKTISEALGYDVEPEHPSPPDHAIQRRGRMIFTSSTGGGAKDERELDEERFFHAIDRAVHDHVSKQSRLPLILAALPEHHQLFHKISKNPYLIASGIKTNPKALQEDELKRLAWEVMEPKYHARQDGFKDEFLVAQSRQQGSSVLEEVATAAVERKVSTLLVESDRILPGTINEFSGEIVKGSVDAPDSDDVLDDLAALVERNGGKVYVIPKEHMPVDTGLAAIYRY